MTKIQGFDYEGTEQFWTVSGDTVTSMTILDFNKDGTQELVVGSDDFQIRVFQNEEIITEITETEKVNKLKALGGNKFGYGLSNGTVGVYEGTERVWRGKTKHDLTSLESFDLDGDGVNEIACGWSSGKFEVRSDKTGEVIYRDAFGAAIAGIVTADYRGDGCNQIICVSAQGEVRAYTQAPPELRGNLMGKRVDEEVMKDLNQQKQQLLQELHNYESNLAAANKNDTGVIPKTTQVFVALEMNPKEKCIDLLVSTNHPEAIIRGVVLISEQIFTDESYVQ